MTTVSPAEQASAPVLLNGFSAALCILQFVRDPLSALRKIHADHGPFVVLGHVLPSIPAKPNVMAVGAAFNREVLGNPEVWRTAGIVLRGPKGSAQSRLRAGIVRSNGREHAHYRPMISAPLARPRIEKLGDQMMQIAQSEIGAWPGGGSVELWPLVRTLMRRFAISLLFGNDNEHATAVAEMLREHVQYNYDPMVVGCPVNVHGTRYHSMLQHSIAFERRIVDWVKTKKSECPDGRDLLSLVANNPDENGKVPSDEAIAGHVPTLFGASFETCQSVLFWTLVLLIQHPGVARALSDELSAADENNFEQTSRLPLLEAVVNESMRILPPVPLQFRVSTQSTQLQGYRIPDGTRVCLSPFLTNRSSALFPNPDRFDPQRWFSIKPSAYECLVFSAGPRSCPGFWFGRSVVKTALVAIMRRWRLAFSAGTRIDYKVNIAMEPGPGVLVKILSQDGMFSAGAIGGKINDLVAMPN
jgi:cytochrome P450